MNGDIEEFLHEDSGVWSLFESAVCCDLLPMWRNQLLKVADGGTPVTLIDDCSWTLPDCPWCLEARTMSTSASAA